jgi:hypothetical protein
VSQNEAKHARKISNRREGRTNFRFGRGDFLKKNAFWGLLGGHLNFTQRSQYSMIVIQLQMDLIELDELKRREHSIADQIKNLSSYTETT